MRAYPNNSLMVEEETVEVRLAQLCEMKLEYRAAKKAFDNKYKNLRDSIKSLENIITDEVIKAKRTVVVGDIKAEYIPTVSFKLKKEKDNE